MKKAALLIFLLIIIPCTLTAKEPTGKPILRLNTDMHFAIVRRISADMHGETFLTCSSDKTAKLWSASDGSLLKTLQIPIGEGNEGSIFACSLSPDGKTAALGGWTGEAGNRSIFIYDTATAQMKQKISGLENIINDLEFSDDGILAAALYGSAGIRIYKKVSGRYILTASDKDYGDDCYNLAFDHSGRLASVSHDGHLRLYNTGFKLIRKIRVKNGRRPFMLAFSPDGGKIAVGMDDTASASVYDSRTLDFLYSPYTSDTDKPGAFSCVAFDRKGNLYGGGMLPKKFGDKWWRIIRKWKDEGRGSHTDFKGSGNTIMDIKALPDGSLLTAGSLPDIARYDSSGRKIFYLSGEVVSFRNYQYRYLSLNSDGSRVSFKPSGRQQMTFDVNSRELKRSNELFDKYTDSRDGIKVTDWLDSYHPKINGKDISYLDKYERNRSTDISGDGTVLMGANWNIHALDMNGHRKWRTAVPGVAWAVKASGNGKTAVAAHNGGELRWYRMSDGKLLMSLYIHPDENRWVLYTTEGYYDASAGAGELVGWHINNGADKAASVYPLSKFSERFYRPDVMAGILKYLDIDKALAAANRNTSKKFVTASLKQMLPPDVTILSPKDGVKVSTNNVTIRYKIDKKTNEDITDVRVLVDGRPAGERALKPKRKAGTGEVNVSIPSSDCTVTIIAENRFSSSNPAAVRIKWEGEAGYVIKPKLYVLAIGVSNYKDKSLQLEYAAKDARDFTNVLKKQKNKFYRDVQVKLLDDKKATKGDILDGLDWILHETTQKDVAMVFFAGHGVDDEYGNYYYLPENVDPARLRRTAVAYTDIKNAMVNIAGKAIFFIDTCHSGDVLGQRRGVADTNAIVNELVSAQNGVVVFTSSSGRQYSLENSSWGNGAFTKALVEGLSGKAAMNSPKITLNMLDLYISERVKKLTDGRQTPTTAKPRTISDFPIALK